MEERRLSNLRTKLQIRCDRALSAKPSHRKLNANEIAYFKWAVSEEPPASTEGRPSRSIQQARPDIMRMLTASRKQDHTQGVAPPIAGEKRGVAPGRVEKPELIAPCNHVLPIDVSLAPCNHVHRL